MTFIIEWLKLIKSMNISSTITVIIEWLKLINRYENVVKITFIKIEWLKLIKSMNMSST